MPETLGAAVLRALEGDPSRRYASADELAGGLQLGLQGEDVTLPIGEGATPTRVLGGGDGDAAHSSGRQRTEYRPAPSPTRRPVARARRQPVEAQPKAGRVLALPALRLRPGRPGPDRGGGGRGGDHRHRQGGRGEGEQGGGEHG